MMAKQSSSLKRQQEQPSSTSRVPIVSTFLAANSSSSPLPLLPLVGPRVCRHRHGYGSRALHEPARPPQGQSSSVQVSTHALRAVSDVASGSPCVTYTLPRAGVGSTMASVPTSLAMRVVGGRLSLVRLCILLFFWCHACRSHPFVAFR